MPSCAIASIATTALSLESPGAFSLGTLPRSIAPLHVVTLMPHPDQPFKINTSQVHNRILALMAHTNRYAFKGESRLAQDAGVSKSAVCRLLNGQTSPSFALVSALTKALEKHLQRELQGKRLDPHELISLDGTYPTASACELSGCRGCLPAEAYDNEGCLRQEFKDILPGQWSITPSLPACTLPTCSAKEAR